MFEQIKMFIGKYCCSDYDKIMLEIKKLNDKVDKIYSILAPQNKPEELDIVSVISKVENLFCESLAKEMARVDNFLSGYVKEKKEKDKKVINGEVKSSFKRKS